MKTKLTMAITIILTTLLAILPFARGNPQTLTAPENDTVQSKALSVLQQKCNICHRYKNPRKVFTEKNMNGLAQKIYKQVFVKKRMPKGKAIQLSNKEKQILLKWLETQVNTKD